MATCAGCGEAISAGDAFREVNTPTGAKRVHARCLEAPSGLRTLDGDQGEILPRARPRKPPRPEELPGLYASGALRPAPRPESERSRSTATTDRPRNLELFPSLRR